MLSPRLTNCPECANIPSLLKKIDCKLAELGNSLYNNISYMLNQPIPAGDILQLIAYRRILMHKYCNPNYVHEYSVAMIASRVIRLTVGCVSRCNEPERCLEEPCDITIVPNPPLTTTTTTTLPITTTTTSTTGVPTTTTTTTNGPAPSCPDRRVVFQICNSNSAVDDNFDIYLNGTYIGAVDLNASAQVGSVFIADSDPLVVLGSSDFVCPLTLMVTYHFPSSLLLASNVLEMRNTQNNGNGNVGSIGVRNYSLSGTTLSNPCVITNLGYSGASGASFTFNFNYTTCCAGDTTTTTSSSSSTTTSTTTAGGSTTTTTSSSSTTSTTTTLAPSGIRTIYTHFESLTPLTTTTTSSSTSTSSTSTTSTSTSTSSTTTTSTTIPSTSTTTSTSSSTSTTTTTTTIAPVAFGLMYNWYAARDSRNIAAIGWEVPTIFDYQTLADYLGAAGNYNTNTVGGRLKEIGLTYWLTPNTGAINDVGFNGKGSGVRNVTFTTKGSNCNFWTTSEPFSNFGGASQLYNTSAEFVCLSNVGYASTVGYSIRLKKITTTLTNGQTGTYVGNDGRVYRTICIGTQEWLADDLCETRFRNLDIIPYNGLDNPNNFTNSEWAALSTAGTCAYNNDVNNVAPGFNFPI